MPGKGYSGKGGTAHFGTADSSSAATEIVEVTKWTLDMTAAVSKYNSNKTGGHKRAVSGVRDTKGTIEIKVDGTAGVAIATGAAVSLKLTAGPVAANDYFMITHAVISGNPIECDIDNGEVVGMTYSFEASDVEGFGIFASATP